MRKWWEVLCKSLQISKSAYTRLRELHFSWTRDVILQIAVTPGHSDTGILHHEAIRYWHLNGRGCTCQEFYITDTMPLLRGGLKEKPAPSFAIRTIESCWQQQCHWQVSLWSVESECTLHTPVTAGASVRWPEVTHQGQEAGQGCQGIVGCSRSLAWDSCSYLTWLLLKKLCNSLLTVPVWSLMMVAGSDVPGPGSRVLLSSVSLIHRHRLEWGEWGGRPTCSEQHLQLPAHGSTPGTSVSTGAWDLQHQGSHHHRLYQPHQLHYHHHLISISLSSSVSSTFNTIINTSRKE